MAKSDLRAMLANATQAAPVTRIDPGVVTLSSEEIRLIHRGYDLRKLAESRAREAERIAERRFEVGCAAAQRGDHDFAAEVAGGCWDHVL